MELALKIRDFIQRGRELYVQARVRTTTACCRACAACLDLSQFDLDMDHEELKGKLRCAVCGTIDRVRSCSSRRPIGRCGRDGNDDRKWDLGPYEFSPRCGHRARPGGSGARRTGSILRRLEGRNPSRQNSGR